MDRIHDKANKLFNEVRKKKIKVSNIGIHKDGVKNDIRSVSDLSAHTCLFCDKVFINSHYLMKHVYRRHAENLVKLHRKCLLLDSNSSADFKSLFTFLEEEFLAVKSELSNVKQAIGFKIPGNEDKEKSESKEPLEYVCHMNENVCSDVAVADIDSRDIDLLKENVQTMESNIQGLHNKIEELNSNMKTEILFRQDVLKHKVLQEENFLKEQESQLIELKRILVKELKCTLSQELNESESKWKSKFSELKHDISKLNHDILSLKKQIDSPDYLTTVEKILEQNIVNFLGTPRRRTIKSRSSRIRNKSSKGHRTLHNNKALEINDHDKQITFPIPEGTPFKPSSGSNKLHISPEELTFLITEKLSHFDISHTTSRLSSTEYEEKLKLINSVKESLSKKYLDFSEIYKNINVYADQRVFSKLKNKKQRKLRFSEPLIVSKDKFLTSEPNEAYFLNKSFPVLKNKNVLAHENPKLSPCNIKTSTVLEAQRFIVPTSERFSSLDVGGGGESSGNFPDIYHTSIKETFTQIPTKESKISSPIADIPNSENTDCSSEKNSSFFNYPIFSDYKSIGSENAEIESTYHMLDDLGKQDVPYFEHFKIDNTELKDINSELDDFDENSLKSLSSWEDEENSR